MLWLLEGNPGASRNLRREAELRGVAPERLIFAGRLDLSEHLARHRLADLFLDTCHYNAHTTASDALWAGLPVLTRLGGSFAGRVAASLLKAVGLDELVVGDQDEYADMALALARDPARLQALRGKLWGNRLTCPLFDTQATTRQIEAAYQEMLARHRQGLAPAEIRIEA